MLSASPSTPSAPALRGRLWKPAACAAQGALALSLLVGTPAAYAEDGITHVPAERQTTSTSPASPSSGIVHVPAERQKTSSSSPAASTTPSSGIVHVPAEQQLRGSSAQAPTAVDVLQTTRTAIPFTTVRRADKTRYKGVEKVVQAGRTGILERTFAVVTAAGTEVSRTMLSEQRTREPRTKIVAVGTKAKPVAKKTRAAKDGRNWAALARCESGGNPRAVNASGKYRGMYQFDLRTWRSVGGTGDPAKHSADEQTFRAQKLYQSRGRSPWPHCGRYL